MAAASVNLSCFLATRPITSTRSSSRVLIAVLFNKTSLAGGLSLRGHFYSVREGTLSKSFNSFRNLFNVNRECVHMNVLAFIGPGALIVVAGLVMFWIDAKLS